MGRFERALNRIEVERATAGRATVIYQAAPPQYAYPQATTPRPLEIDDYGPANTQSLYSVRLPTPEQINLLFLKSHELASTIKRLRMDVWRKALRIVPDFTSKCIKCGAESDDETTDCKDCGEAGVMRKPNEQQRRVLMRWQEDANEEGHTLEEFGGDIEDDGNKHPYAFVVYRFDYNLRPDGAIDLSHLKELRRGDPVTFWPIQSDDGRMGGRVRVCVRCRERDGDGSFESSELAPCPKCGGVTYDAWYRELGQGAQGKVRYYLKQEVHHLSLHYRGSSPISRLWDKSVALLWMDELVKQTLDPAKDKRPDKLLGIIGGSEDSIEKWVQKDAMRRQRNPLALRTLHVQNPGDKLVADMKVLDLGDETLKLQSPEIRKEFERQIRAEYGLGPIHGGDREGGGGLSNDSLELRNTAQVVAHHQSRHRAWLDRFAEAVGVTDYHYEFEEGLLEEETLDADKVLKLLEVAEKAQGLGLPVRWEDDQPVIGDGDIKPPPAPAFPPGLGFGVPSGGARLPPASTPGPDASVMQQAGRIPSRDDDVPAGLEAVFGGPSAAAELSAALYHEAYAGLTPEQSALINAEIRDSLTQPQGWSEQSIADRVRPVLERAGIAPQEAARRSLVIARVEAGAVLTEFRLQQFRQRETEQGEEARVRVVGPSDARTTKLSYYIRSRVGDGLPLSEALREMDAAINLAKDGAFAEGGALSNLPGEPIRLDPGFRRRGTICHYGDRDWVVSAQRGGS